MIMAIQISTSLVLGIFYVYGVHSADITVRNNCGFEVWPATQTGSGAAILTGFDLAPQAARTVSVSAPWSGRFWGRTQCSDNAGIFTCATGDCGSGQVGCNGAGGAPPASLVEFTVGGADGLDTYDVSLVDGFNLPVSVGPDGGSCTTTSCPADTDSICPDELAVRDGSGAVIGCKSACAAFNQPQYCCTGDYDSPETCKPTDYSQIFKMQCPQAYSYAYDDPSSTFTCLTGANYVVTFCPPNASTCLRFES